MTLRAYLHEQEQGFLLSLIKATGSVHAAARMAGISVATLYRRLPKAGRRYTQDDLEEVRLRVAQEEASKPLPEPVHRPVIPLPPDPRASWLLEFFGVMVERGEGCKGDLFWERHSGRLDVLYFEARKGYLAMVRRLHPDGGSGDSERMAQVNAAWSRLEEAFRKHGWTG